MPHIAVIGGGVSGLATARALNALGFHRVKVFERFHYANPPAAVRSTNTASALTEQPHVLAQDAHHSSAGLLAPNGVEVLRLLGLREELLQYGVAVTRQGQAISSGERTWVYPLSQLMKFDQRTTEAPPPVQVDLARRDLLDVLLHALPAGSVFAGHTLIGLRVKPIVPKEREERRREREERRCERELRQAKLKKQRHERELQVGTQFRGYGADLERKTDEREDEEETEPEIELSFSNGHIEHVHFVVAADGRLSTVRSLLFSRPGLRYSGDVCVAATVRVPLAERQGFLPFPASDFFDIWGRGTRFCYAELNAEVVHWACYLDRKKVVPVRAGRGRWPTVQCQGAVFLIFHSATPISRL